MVPRSTQARSLPLSLAALTLATAAYASPPLRLSVVRAQDAVDCPDSAQLSAMVAALARPGAPAAAVLVDAQFFMGQGQYTVELRISGERAGQRTLSDPGPTCAGLGEAAALTIAMLLDPQLVPAPPPPAPPAPARPAPPPPPPVRPSLSLALGALGTTGLTASPAAGALVDASLAWPRGWRAGLGAAWQPARSFDLPPGEVRVGLVAALAHGCWSAPVGGLRAGGCGRVGAGVYLADASGFSRNESPREVWVGAGASGLLGGALAGPVGWELQLGWMASPRRRSFVIDGAGVAFDPSSLGGVWASLQATVRAW